MSIVADFSHDLELLLRRAAAHLSSTALPRELAADMEHLADQVDQPCVVAVVGRVKAGKSTFIKALLGEDLAKVGTTETTATINYFRYGVPLPGRPVRCYWRSGQVTDESRAFLDGLQGNDLETLRRADGIDHLEYRLNNPYLERVTLVDTPGTGAAIDEHQDRTAEFMRLHGELRERHDQEARRLGGEADAVIYITGHTARVSDREFLDEFQRLTDNAAGAINAIGVMAKIDLQPELIACRSDLATKVANQLKTSLNVVLPVSAAMHRSLDRLLVRGDADLRHLRTVLRTISPVTLEKLLASEAFYLELEPQDCPVTIAERKRLLGDDMPWTVFTTIARLAANPVLTPESVVAQVESIAGFDTLRDVLERRFLKRSRFLRCYRIANDARRLLETIEYQHLPQARQRERDDETRRDQFLAFVRQSNGDPATARDLETYLKTAFTRPAALDTVMHDLERAFGHIFHRLEEFSADYQALQLIESSPDLFTDPEREELGPLLGLYGLETERRLPPDRITVDHLEERQQFWRQKSQFDRQEARREVAERAATRYAFILEELLDAAHDA